MEVRRTHASRPSATPSHGPQLLTPSEQAAFRRLAVFAGGAAVDAAEAVIGSVPGAVAPSLDDIAALVDHSLLKAEGAVANDTPRVRMLETIREYAVEQMRDSR